MMRNFGFLRKFGASVAVIDGVIIFTISLLELFMAMDIMPSQKWVNDLASITGVLALQSTIADLASVSTSWLYGITIFFGTIQLSLGLLAYRKTKGLASLALLGLFLISLMLITIKGAKTSSWPIAETIAIITNGIASVEIMFGMLNRSWRE